MNKLTFGELICSHWPTATPDQIEALLWCTVFPFAPGETIKAEIDRLADRFNDINSAIDHLMGEFDSGMTTGEQNETL